jgi:hypothetical protein
MPYGIFLALALGIMETHAPATRQAATPLIDWAPYHRNVVGNPVSPTTQWLVPNQCLNGPLVGPPASPLPKGGH